jgi:hypothetical protein
VTLLLGEGAEKVVHRPADGEIDHGAHVLPLDIERPALVGLAATDRSSERIGRRIAAPKPPQIDDVPRAARIVA